MSVRLGMALVSLLKESDKTLPENAANPNSLHTDGVLSETNLLVKRPIQP